jgi:Sigma-70 region 2
MNIRAGLRYSIENPEVPGGWKYCQRHVCPRVIMPYARVRALGATIRVDSTRRGGQRVTQPIAVSSGSVEMNFMSQLPSEDEVEIVSRSQNNLKTFDVLFSRYRRVLSFVACRVLGDLKDAQDAVENSFLTASYRMPPFEDEGAFRSWLVRVLLDEALLILHKKSGIAS